MHSQTVVKGVQDCGDILLDESSTQLALRTERK